MDNQTEAAIRRVDPRIREMVERQDRERDDRGNRAAKRAKAHARTATEGEWWKRSRLKRRRYSIVTEDR